LVDETGEYFTQLCDGMLKQSLLGFKVIRFLNLNFQTFNKPFINKTPKYVRILKQIEFGNNFLDGIHPINDFLG